jgi:hypothetical protein
LLGRNGKLTLVFADVVSRKKQQRQGQRTENALMLRESSVFNLK